MLRRGLKPLAVTVFGVGGSAYLYNTYSKPKLPVFDLTIRERSPDGQRTESTRPVTMIPSEEVDARLRENAVLKTTRRPGGIIWNRTTASLSSNDPIEDASANAIVERDASDSTSGDLLFFAVMDGHSGLHTSHLLSQVLLPAVGTEISSLIKEPYLVIPKPSKLQQLKSLSWSSLASPVSLDADPKYFALAIQSAFSRLDSEITNAPLRLLKAELEATNSDKGTSLDLSKHPMALETMQPALSGSCALLAVVDTANQNLYVACTGDSRAVAGIWEEGMDGKGSWKVEVLSEDQTGRNENEVARIKSEHPPDEADSVIRNGRVLGGLEPARAFGDARYKWSSEVQKLLSDTFMEGKMRAWPGPLKTPPYVTARPVVTHRKLPFLPLPPLPSQPQKSALRFIVLATDGLWDRLSSEEVVALVGGHLAGLKGTISQSQLNNLVPTSSGSPTVEGKIKPSMSSGPSWAFVDDNLSSHLIRNALGGADWLGLRKLLSIPAPYSRRYRDDITVTVVWWEDSRDSNLNTTTFTTDLPKAKL